MALLKGTIWDPKTKQYVGTVDYGTAVPEPLDELATKALVFMISSLTGHFKDPITYVLQDKCTASVQAQLIRDCIGILHDAGINVLALVFDGCYTNQSSAKLLCCKMKVSEIPHTPHTPHTSFHRFPHKKPELLRKWVHNVKRKDWAPNEHSLLCSKHFDESCFVVGK